MRDFLNEDELYLLKSNCSSGMLDLTEAAFDIPEAQAFKLGSYEAFSECINLRSISKIEDLMACAKAQEDKLSISNFDGRLDSKIDFYRAKYLQTKFILNCLFAFRCVKDTGDQEDSSSLTPQHFAFVHWWRESEEVLDSYRFKEA